MASSLEAKPSLITYLIVVFVKLVDVFVIAPISLLAWFKKPKRCPLITNKLLLKPATELAREIRKGKLSSKAVVRAYIDRINEVNVVINSVIKDRFEHALEEAEKVDALVASGKFTEAELEEKLPLLGVPVTVKGSIAVEGMPLTGGLKFKNMEKRRAKTDADTVRQLKEAGGVVMLISNCPELCCSFECSNMFIGTTNNPYDTRRTSGGSSGGEASLLSTGGSIIGLGSDLMGSCRVPAAFCGVFGHKPSAEAVSVEGHFPNCGGERKLWTTNFLLGPLTRYAQDLPMLLEVLLKPEKRKVLNLREPVNLQDLKIYYCFNDNGNITTHQVDDEIVTGMKKVVSHFKDVVGCHTEEIKLKKLKQSTTITVGRLLSMDDIDDVFDKQPRSVVLELIKIIFRCSNHTLSALMYVVGKRFFDKWVTNEQKRKVDDSWAALLAEFKTILKEDSVFLYPTSCTAAFHHGQFFGKFFDGSYTGIFNVMGFPATSCPMGFNSERLPIGVQVVANMDCDRLNMAVAQEMQKAFGGWQPPPFQ